MIILFWPMLWENPIQNMIKVILNLASKNGLRVFDIKQNDINGGSKQYLICHNNSKIKSNTKKIVKILKIEKKQKLDKIITYKNFI